MSGADGKATAEHTRQRILETTAQLSRSSARRGHGPYVLVADIASRLDLSKDTVRPYLAALVADGLLNRNAVGHAKVYRLTPSGEAQVP